MFSNSTEARMWWYCNCRVCAKYESESRDREKAKCKAAFDIDLGYVTGELPARVERIIKKSVCTFRIIASPRKNGFCKRCQHCLFVSDIYEYCKKHRDKTNDCKKCSGIKKCRFFENEYLETGRDK